MRLLASLLALLLLGRATARRQRALAGANSALEREVARRTAALAESEARLSRVQRIGRVGGFEIDLRSGINRRSAEYMSLQGQPPAAAVEAHADWVRRLHPEDRTRAEACFLAAISDTSGITEYAQEYRIVTPEGETRWIAARAEVERTRAGRAVRMVGAHVDVTALRATEAALRASEARLRLAQEAAGIGVWERSYLDGSVTWSDEQFRLLGLEPRSVPPSRAAMLAMVLPEDRDSLTFEHAAERLAREDGRFRHEFRIRRADDGATRWLLGLGQVRAGADGRPARVVGVNLDITDRKLAEEHQALLTRELDHRAKNALAVVQAALRLTPRTDLQSFVRAVEGRVAALARAHTLLAAGKWSGAALHTLLRGELEPFGGADGRVQLDGPPVLLAPLATQPLSMAVHELATNAVKYGALSAQEGRVTIRWHVEPGGVLHLCWEETGGPSIAAPPTARGFGSRVVEGTIRDQLGGAVRREWRPGGLCCTVTMPLLRGTTPDATPSVDGPAVTPVDGREAIQDTRVQAVSDA